MTVSQVGASKAANIRTRGSMVASQAKNQGFSQGVGSLGNAFSIFAGI